MSSVVVVTKEKTPRSACWHKHAMVSCCAAMANTGISISKYLTRLIDLVPISRVARKRLGLISGTTKVGCCVGTFAEGHTCR